MRRQIAALAAGITLGFATTAASAQQLTEIKISYQPALYWALPFYVAEQKGWYAELGLKPVFSTFPAGVPQIAGVFVERLRRAGVADAYAMPGNGRDVTISLGLFSERQRALRRLDDAKAVGLAPRIVDRERAGTVYWIDVDVVPPATLPDAARLQGEAGRILRLEVTPCPSSLT